MPTPPTGRAARLKDVADHAGVSTGTVSNVLNHPAKVSEETIQRVRASIAALGFVRDANASSLAAGGSRSIGLVVIDLGNSMFVEAARGAQTAAREAGLNLMISGSEDDFSIQSDHVDGFNEARVAGLLLAPMQDSSEQIARVTRRGKPVVLMNYDPGSSHRCCAVVDNEQVGYLAARHLIDQGCTRLAFVYSALSAQPVTLRRQGVRRAIAEADGVVYEELATPTLRPEAAVPVARALAARGPSTRPDGVIAVTDLLATGLLGELARLGIDVPGQIAVMGCDDNRSAEDPRLTLTTVRMRAYDMGAAAMALLIEEMSGAPGGHVHQRVVLEPELVPRMSTARLGLPPA